MKTLDINTVFSTPLYFEAIETFYLHARTRKTKFGNGIYRWISSKLIKEFLELDLNINEVHRNLDKLIEEGFLERRGDFLIFQQYSLSRFKDYEKIGDFFIKN